MNTGTEDVTVGVWDTTGNEAYDKLRPLSYPITDVFILWFDVTKPSTYESILEKVRAFILQSYFGHALYDAWTFMIKLRNID